MPRQSAFDDGLPFCFTLERAGAPPSVFEGGSFFCFVSLGFASLSSTVGASHISPARQRRRQSAKKFPSTAGRHNSTTHGTPPTKPGCPKLRRVIPSGAGQLFLPTSLLRSRGTSLSCIFPVGARYIVPSSAYPPTFPSLANFGAATHSASKPSRHSWRIR